MTYDNKCPPRKVTINLNFPENNSHFIKNKNKQTLNSPESEGKISAIPVSVEELQITRSRKKQKQNTTFHLFFPERWTNTLLKSVLNYQKSLLDRPATLEMTVSLGKEIHFPSSSLPKS